MTTTKQIWSNSKIAEKYTRTANVEIPKGTNLNKFYEKACLDSFPFSIGKNIYSIEFGCGTQNIEKLVQVMNEMNITL